jgi:hypothetical protein
LSEHGGDPAGQVICPTGAGGGGLSSPFGKNILVFRIANHPYIHSRLVPLKGALAIVTTRGGMRWTRMVLLTRVLDADGEDVWS